MHAVGSSSSRIFPSRRLQKAYATERYTPTTLLLAEMRLIATAAVLLVHCLGAYACDAWNQGLPTPTGTVSSSAVIEIAAGQVFDGGWKKVMNVRIIVCHCLTLSFSTTVDLALVEARVKEVRVLRPVHSFHANYYLFQTGRMLFSTFMRVLRVCGFSVSIFHVSRSMDSAQCYYWQEPS